MPTKTTTVDITPTWSGILPVMLQAYANHIKSRASFRVGGSKKHLEVCKNIHDLEEQFQVMAKAADRYNEVVPLLNKGKGN